MSRQFARTFLSSELRGLRQWQLFGQRLRVKAFQLWVPEPVTPYEVNHKQHQQPATNKNANRNFESYLEVANVGDFPDDLWTKTAKQLRDKHVDAHRNDMRPPGNHVVNNRNNEPLVPGQQ